MMENLKGLTEKEAKKRLKDYGFNELKEILHISPLKILLKLSKKSVPFKAADELRC